MNFPRIFGCLKLISKSIFAFRVFSKTKNHFKSPLASWADFLAARSYSLPAAQPSQPLRSLARPSAGPLRAHPLSPPSAPSDSNRTAHIRVILARASLSLPLSLPAGAHSSAARTGHLLREDSAMPRPRSRDSRRRRVASSPYRRPFPRIPLPARRPASAAPAATLAHALAQPTSPPTSRRTPPLKPKRPPRRSPSSVHLVAYLSAHQDPLVPL